MSEGALKIGGRHGLQQTHPALMQRLEQRQRDFERRFGDLACFRPTRFVVRLNYRVIFRQRKFKPDIGI